jgi:hypothetical protein
VFEQFEAPLLAPVEIAGGADVVIPSEAEQPPETVIEPAQESTGRHEQRYSEDSEGEQAGSQLDADGGPILDACQPVGVQRGEAGFNPRPLSQGDRTSKNSRGDARE